MKKILSCKKCNLYKNQKPLIEKSRKAEILILGLSAVKINPESICEPLAKDTRTGKFVNSFIKTINKTVYKTNLVKCLPLDLNEKIRYPTKSEMSSCLNNFRDELKKIEPKVVLLLGKQVAEFVLDKPIEFPKLKDNIYEYQLIEKDNIMFIPTHHPSYINKMKKEVRDLWALKLKEDINNKIDEIFYITKTGKKLHKKNCSFLRDNVVSISSSDIRQKKYVKCKRCF